jgi:hypothetical protein
MAGRREMFQAGCACWMPGGAFCIAVSWLAGWRQKLGPWKGPSRSSFRSAEQRAEHRVERSPWWLAGWRGSAFFNMAAPQSSLQQRLSAGDQAFYRGPPAEWSPSRAVSQVRSVAATDERWRCWPSLAEPVVTLLVQQTFSCRQRIHELY